MEKRPDTLSYHRLLDRAQFYKQKALAQEQQLVMLQEEIDMLKQAAMEQPKPQVIIEENKSALEEKMALEEKTDSYERLLKDMESLIHEQETRLGVYEKRLAFYERQLKGVGIKGGHQPIKLSPPIKSQKKGYQAIIFADYTTIWQEKRLSIRGDCHVENTGTTPLSTPLICFRFNPGDLADMKGKIYDTNHTPLIENEDAAIQWMYMDNAWSEEARSRGELWLHPIQNISLEPGGTLSLRDFQIPVDRTVTPQLVIELYAYFSKEDYRIKGLNHLAVNGLI